MEEWKRLLPAGLGVQQTASKGKGLFTFGKEFKAGDIALEASPIALIISKDEREDYCHYCLKEKKLVITCVLFHSCYFNREVHWIRERLIVFWNFFDY